ncbi:unnamed protein product, partial [Polarella glacialis]
QRQADSHQSRLWSRLWSRSQPVPSQLELELEVELPSKLEVELPREDAQNDNNNNKNNNNNNNHNNNHAQNVPVVPAGTEVALPTATDVAQAEPPAGKDDVGSISMPVQSSAIPPCTYRVRGDGFRTFDLEVQPTETVAALCERLAGFLRPDVQPGTLFVQLNHRDPGGGGMLELSGSCPTALVCDVVPHRSMLNVRVVDSSGATATRAATTTATTTTAAESREDPELQ